MKRNVFLILTLVLLFAFTLTGCAVTGNQIGSVGMDDDTTPNPADGKTASVAMNSKSEYYDTFSAA